MINMVIGESRHSEVAVIIAVLPSNIDLPFPFCRFDKVFGE